MSVMTVDQLTAQLLKLPAKDRAVVASRLLGSLDDEQEVLSVSEVEALWISEAKRRIDSYEKGETGGIPVDEIFRRHGQPPG